MVKADGKAVLIISLSIGQGEMGLTPLQIANFAACIANRGYWITPHVVKSIDGLDTIPSKYTEKNRTSIDRKHYETIIQGMIRVVAPEEPPEEQRYLVGSVWQNRNITKPAWKRSFNFYWLCPAR